MDSQIIKIGSNVVNISNITHAEFDSVPAKSGVRREEAEDFEARAVLHMNATTSVVLEGEEAELMRAYFDQFAFDLVERSTNHATGGES